VKKIFIILLIFIFILSINLSFADNSTDVLTESAEDAEFLSDSSDIYVSNEGSDSLGDGSLDKPYQTLNYTIDVASNNTNIYLKSGTYNSTGYEIVNKSISIVGLGEVVVDGKNGEISQSIFKVRNGSSLVLDNIRFVNGYADKNGDLSTIINEGNLNISNCNFYNFTTINGAIENYNYICLNNITSSNLMVNWEEIYGDIVASGGITWVLKELEHPPRGELILNGGYCLITNSNIESTIHNSLNMNIDTSYISYFISNRKFLNKDTFTHINNSNIQKIKISNCTSIVFNNTYINCQSGGILIESSNIFIEHSTFSKNKNYNAYLHFGDSNVTVISTVFNNDIAFGKGTVNITYSTILGKVAIGYDGVYDINYNWWGNNKGPRTSNNNEYSNIYANKWIVMTINDLGDSVFSVDLTKYTSGNNIYDLSQPSKFTPRLVKLETESGEFSNNNGYLVNATFESKLFNNNPNTIMYATVDNQVLRMPIGEGLTDYKIYISDSEGNDFFNDGTYDNPYKTLKKAISMSFSGNTIYMMSGFYTLSWNSGLKISKNLTITGIGDVTLARPNNRNIFIVDSKGLLTLENLDFTTATIDNYYNPLIELSSGNLNVKSCNFHDITSQAVIIVKNNEYINLDNVTFNNIKGPAILGFSSTLFVNNSRFSNGSIISLENSYYGFKYNKGDINKDHLDYYITLSATITVINTTFSDNTVGAIGYYDTGIQFEFWNAEIDFYTKLKTYIYDSTFINNRWDKDVYKNLDMALAIGNATYHNYGYAVIDNCTFLNNTGHIMFVSVINNSKFINNSAIPYTLRTDVDFQSKGSYYYPSCLIQSDIINNSYFYGNSYLSKKYEEMIINANKVYSSVFIKNKAAYGGALSNCSDVHYCIFVNNTATYGGNDIFCYSGDLNCSSNWWGSNQKPDSSRIYAFLGNLIIDDWVIMSITQESDLIKASLDNLLDNNKNIYKLNHALPTRFVEFSTERGNLTPQSTFLMDNNAYAKLIKNTTEDFDVFAQIDNQKISLKVYNNSTLLIVENMTFYGNNNKFNITLQNINGHKISNQLLNIVVKNSTSVKETFSLTTDDNGFAYLDIDYPVGNYDIDIGYYGNGYFEKSYAQASIKVLLISTILVSHNYTFYGKNNKFYVLLADKYGKYVSNQSVILKIFNSKNKLISTSEARTSSNGRADVLLSLDTGNYKLIWEYIGNEWYGESHSESYIIIKPINTTIELPNSTLYGKGNDYKLTFRDAYGTLISDETITLIISNATDSNKFSLKTEKGIATININLIPGIYNIEAIFTGDDVYGASNAQSILNIEPVFVTLDYASRISIPENGVFTVILKDLYGKKVSGENVSLELIYKTFNKKYTAISNGNGEADFKIDAGENNYFGLIEYGGSTWYRGASGASTITISHDVVLNNVYLNGSDFTAYYGENKYYTILFNDSNAYSLDGKIIQVIISSGDWSKSFDVESDIFGNVRLQITLNPGKYNISYKYQNTYYNLYASGRNTIDIFKMPTNLIASDLIVKKDDLKSFEVKLVNKNGVAISNLPVTINIDGKSVNATTNSFGIAKIFIDLDLGYHNVTCSFDNVNYLKSSCSATIFVVNDSKTITKIESSKTYSRECDIFNYSVILSDSLDNPLTSSEIVLNIFDLENNLIYTDFIDTDSNGSGIFNLNLTYGVYLAKTYYKGNDFYFESFNTNNIYISPLENVTETMLISNDAEIVNGNNEMYSVILKTVDGESISNASVEFVVNGQNYFTTTDGSGKAYLNALFKPGAYEVKTKFNGSNNLTKASAINHIHVLRELLYMLSSDIVKSFNNGSHYYVALFDALGQPLSGKIIKFTLGNDTFENITNENGLACFEVWFNPGKYNITATYQGEYPDEYASVSNNITVLTTLISENITNYYDGSTMVVAAFSNFNDDVLNDTDVFFNINNAYYKVRTDEYGLAFLNIDLKDGNYNLTIYNTLTGQIGLYNIKILSTLTTSNLIKYYKGSNNFKATFKDKNGNLLKNTYVKFMVNNKFYRVKTNSKGVATLKINFKPGKYTITTFNTKTTEKHTNKITIKTIILTKNKKVKNGKKIGFQAKILKSNGKIAKKVTVKFKINKKVYKVKTNSKGIAKLNIKLKKGKYTIITNYNGLSVKNKVEVVKWKAE